MSSSPLPLEPLTLPVGTATMRVGSQPWVAHTGGQLTPAQRRRLLPPLVRAQAVNVFGRLTMLAHANSGRRAEVPFDGLRQPRSDLTICAERAATLLLSPALLNHSHRTYLFGAAVGCVEGVQVDREVLFAAAMLHDTGLRPPVAGVDFTRASAAHALRIAEAVGLSTAATEVMRNAITLHHSPDVTLRGDGAVAYLLSAGAALDVVGLRSWKVPPDLLAQAVAQYPRLGFKREFSAAFAAEAAAVPNGRARLLRRYGAFDLAIKLAPFQG